MSNHPRRGRHPVTKAAGASGTILTLGAALVAATPGTAGAATIQVTSATDDGSGGLTLREAIVQANGTPAEDDIITFAPALNGQTITLTSDIDIEDTLNIQGPGAALLTISGDGSNRIFYVEPSADAFTVSGLTLADGDTGGDGGAIYAWTEGSVTITNMVFTDNYAEGDGGAIEIATASSVSITGSTFDSNYSDSDGGAVHIYAVDGAITVTGNTFTNNQAADYGGGLALYNNDGAASISGTFTGNQASLGGGISIYNNGGTVSITGATITGAAADEADASYGGGVDIYNSDGAVTISTTTIANLQVDEFGGGVRAKGTGDVTIDRSTISGNYASVDGGGIYAYDTGTLAITSSTISGNEAQGDGGGVFFAYEDSAEVGALVISHSTITNNIAGDGGGGVYAYGDVTIDHTIIAGQQQGSDTLGDGTWTVSNSLIGDAALGGGITLDDGGNNQFGVADAGLGPLASNGGPTQTHALLEGSPALNSGDPAFAAPPATDQRGEARVSDEVIDKGAFEAQVDEPPAPTPPGAVPVPGSPTFTG